ncbi:hypothetical protein BDN72DRAFT_779440, partial [Pluteus cervinus]
GPDIDPDVADDPAQIPEPAPSVLDAIWRQFPVDILQKSGNPRDTTKPSYCILDQFRRRCIKLDEFNTARLSNLFTHVQIRESSEDEWNKAFDHLFPPRGHVCSAGATHYPTAKYYVAWKDLMSRVTPEDAQKLRVTMKELFNELIWVPAATAERIWFFGAQVGFVVVPEEASAPGPRILWNPWISGEAVIWGRPQEIAKYTIRIEDVRKEEEEESSEDE